MIELLLVFLAAFGRVFVYGLQTQHVVGLHYRSAFVTSWLMTLGEVVIFSEIVRQGWGAFFPIALGSSCGVVASMVIHQKLWKKGQ